MLIGQMRTYESMDILNSYSYLSEFGEIDLYVNTWKNKGYSNATGDTSLHNIDNELKIVNEQDIITHYSKVPFFKIKNINIEVFDEFINSLSDNMKDIYNTPFHYHSNITTSIPIEYKYQNSIRNNLVELLNYDTLIITRPDMEILTRLPTRSPQENIIYYNHVCHKCVDHFWMGTPLTIIKQLYNVFDNYEKNDNLLPSHLKRDNNELLIIQCIKNNIKIKVNPQDLCKLHFK
jgi:hypothetical protein